MAISFFLTSCGTMVSSVGDRAEEHRELQNEIRKGETELAITGTKLEHGVGTITGGLDRTVRIGGELEYSIRESAENQSEIGEILRSIRERLLDANWLVGIGIRPGETEVQ